MKFPGEHFEHRRITWTAVCTNCGEKSPVGIDHGMLGHESRRSKPQPRGGGAHREHVLAGSVPVNRENPYRTRKFPK